MSFPTIIVTITFDQNVMDGEDIKKDIVSVKDIYGKWKPQSSSQTNSPSTSLMPAGSNNDMRKSDDDIGNVVAKEYLPTEAAESNSNVCDLIQSNNSNLNAHSLVEKNIENKFNYCKNLNLALDKNDAAQFCGRILKRHEITTCLALGVYQPNDYSYPVTDGCSFQKEWFKWFRWLKIGLVVDVFIERNRKDIIQENRKLMVCILDCVKYLSEEMIAFRGKTSNNGKFINLFRTISKRDPSAAAYLMKVEESHRLRKKMAFNFLRSSNIRVVLTTMKRMIVEKIVSNIAEQQKACLICDSTQDFSKKEANVFLLRYLEINSMGDLHPVEKLLEVFTCGETSGKILKGENSTESAVETVMKRYSEILASLSELAESSLSDSETVTVALGVRKRMKNIA
ncbi:hypothetical protein HELRODRAFT_162852 [Helobdella robusta]|uniref:DUF4371 domain-containing protein n=1 Tax=Helobdella robusta TaxID=6412 RepID=T1ETA0_HELRO|nr:hypothetical protein HELRODRAFT_162852 [Helobdella robusta]ESN99329.1 hypothetical protein HELRODRAFT_162852 [Helobdella robusta]